MIVLWCIATGSLLVALAAWRRGRKTAKRLEQLSQMLWELKYQHGELRGQVRRVVGGDAASPTSSTPPAPEGSFVSLESLKR